jgi:hypothetical protein
MPADETQGLLSYAWDLINAREEISVKISDISVPTFLGVNAGVWFGSSLFFYPAEVIKTRQQVDRTPVTGRSVAADSSSHVHGMLLRHGWRSLFHGFWFTNTTCVAANNASLLGCCLPPHSLPPAVFSS